MQHYIYRVGARSHDSPTMTGTETLTPRAPSSVACRQISTRTMDRRSARTVSSTFPSAPPATHASRRTSATRRSCDSIWTDQTPRSTRGGLRNVYQLAFHPEDGTLWAADNGRDDHGYEVPEELNLIVEGGVYGWPHCWGTGGGSQCEGTISPRCGPGIAVLRRWADLLHRRSVPGRVLQ